MTITIEEFGKRFVWECLKQYFGESIFMMVLFALYVVSVCYLAVRGSKKEKALFVYPVVLWLLTVFNPLFVNRFVLMFHVETRYYRYFWMLPVAVLLVYMLVKLLDKCNKGGKIAVVAGVVLVCFLCRSQMLNISEPPTNPYRINDEVVAAADIVAADKTEDSVKVAYNLFFYYEIRQYDASIKPFITLAELTAFPGSLTQEEIDLAIEEQDYHTLLQYVYLLGVEVDTDMLRDMLAAEELDYMFLEKGRGSLEAQLLECGCVEVGQTEHYLVLRCR